MQFDIVANDKATGAMKQAENSMGRFTQNLIGKYTMIAAKAAVAWAAVSKFYNVIKEAGDISDQAAKLGITAEVYQRLKFAAEQYGASVEDMAKALKDVNKLLDEAATKGGPNADILKALGFSQQDIADRAIKAEEVFQRVAMAIKAARSEEEKFAIASRVFGDRIAQSMVPVLDNFAKFNEEAGSIKVVSNENAQAFDALTEKVSRMGETLKNQAINAIGIAAQKVGFIPEQAAAPAKTETPEEAARNQRMRDALLAAGARPAAARTPEMAVTTLQQIGGGIAKGPSILESYAERTANATETLAGIATSTSPAQTGGTDVTSIGNVGKVIWSTPDIVKSGFGASAEEGRRAAKLTR